MNKDIVSAYLDANCAGKKNVIPSQRLEQELHMSGNEIRKQINALRREAVPIASNGRGYFYAENVLAATLKEKDYDGRFSRSNKVWGAQASVSENSRNYQFVVQSYPAVTDGFISQFREL